MLHVPHFTLLLHNKITERTDDPPIRSDIMTHNVTWPDTWAAVMCSIGGNRRSLISLPCHLIPSTLNSRSYHLQAIRECSLSIRGEGWWFSNIDGWNFFHPPLLKLHTFVTHNLIRLRCCPYTYYICLSSLHTISFLKYTCKTDAHVNAHASSHMAN